MKTAEMIVKFFYRPRAVFRVLKEERTWVHAAVFMALMLGIYNLATSIGTIPEARTTSSSELQTLIVNAQRDARESSSIQSSGESTPRELAPKRERVPIDFGRIGLGESILGLFITTILLPVAFAGIWLISVIDAIYFRIVGALFKIDLKLEEWFVLSIWCRIPYVVLSVLTVVIGMITLGRQPNSDELQVFSITHWIDLPRAQYGGDYFKIYFNFDRFEVSLLWLLVVQVIGFQEWSGRSMLFSFWVVLIPTLISIAIAILFTWSA